MTEKEYFVTHSAGCCLCDSISRQLKDGSFEHLTYDDIVNRLNESNKENQTLKAQLLCDIDEGVCSICNHQYLVESGEYYVAKCEKEHEECSKVSLKYCEDFELIRDYDD